MRHTRSTLLYSLLVAALALPGCEKKASETTMPNESASGAPMVASPATQPAASSQPAVASAATQPSATSQPASMTVITSRKDYGFSARADFAADMQRDLDAVKRTLRDLSAKIEASGDKANAATKAKVAALVERAAALTSNIEKAKTAQRAAWEQVKADIKKSNDEFKASVLIARTWLSDKIAP